MNKFAEGRREKGRTWKEISDFMNKITPQLPSVGKQICWLVFSQTKRKNRWFMNERISYTKKELMIEINWINRFNWFQE